MRYTNPNTEIDALLTLEEHDEAIGELRDGIETILSVLTEAGLIEQLPYTRTFKNGKFGYTYLMKTDKPQGDVNLLNVPDPAL